MKVLIGGDFYISKEYLNKVQINPSLLKLFRSSDLNIVNLETPTGLDFETEKNKILKVGPHLITGNEVFNTLKKLSVNLVTLANNHILDYGEKALMNTIEQCQLNNISYVGAGNSIKTASYPIIIEKKGVKIGLVNFCENEWSVATRDNAGANPLDFINVFDQMQYVKKYADFVIIIAHSGHEYYNLPSPQLVKLFRFFARNGADLIVNHHTHAFSGYEYIEGIPIFYGVGNFLFTKHSRFDEWYTGIVIELDVQKGRRIKTNIHFIAQDQNSFTVRLIEGEEKKYYTNTIEKLTKIIVDEQELEEQWQVFLNSRKNAINILSPVNFIPSKAIRALLKLSGINSLILSKKYLTHILNVIRCESHYEVLLSLLKQKISKGK